MSVPMKIRGHRFDNRPVQQHSLVKTDHEIFSVVIFSLPLIQDGHMSVSGQRICTNDDDFKTTRRISPD